MGVTKWISKFRIGVTQLRFKICRRNGRRLDEEKTTPRPILVGRVHGDMRVVGRVKGRQGFILLLVDMLVTITKFEITMSFKRDYSLIIFSMNFCKVTLVRSVESKNLLSNKWIGSKISLPV